MPPEADLGPPPSLHTQGTEWRAQVRPPSSIFEQYEPWTETSAQPQVNLSVFHSNSLKFQPQ
jgi:hypothetical protein